MQKSLRSFWVLFKNLIQFWYDPKIIRVHKLLSILVLPYLGFLFFVLQPLLNFEQLKVASVLFPLVTILISLLFVFNPNSLGLLTFIFRYGLTYKFVQFLFSVCIEIELFLKAPYVVQKLLSVCFGMVYIFFFLESMHNSDMFLLTLHKAIFMIGFIYIRLRSAFFNPDALGVVLNQTVTVGQSFTFLDKSLIDISAQPKFISFKSPFCNKLSTRTNNLVVPFLTQTKGMTVAAASKTITRVVKTAHEQNPNMFQKIGAWAMTGIGGGGLYIANDQFKNERQISSAQKISKNRIESDERMQSIQHDIDAKAREELMKREDRATQASTQKYCLDTISHNNQEINEINKQKFPDLQARGRYERSNESAYDLMRSSTTSVDNSVSSLSATGPFISSVLELPKESIGSVVFKMLYFWF